jgi:MFS family permease
MDGVTRALAGFVGFRLFRNLVFHYAVIVPIYYSHGLTAVQVGLIEGVYWTVKSTLDVPTGYVADRFGRRFAVVSGTTIVAVGYCTIALAAGFETFTLGFGVLAFGHSLCTGADSALLQTALETAGQGARYTRYEMAGWAARSLGLALSMLAGAALLGSVELSTLVWLSAVFTVPAIFFPFLIGEASRKAAAPPDLRAFARLFKKAEFSKQMALRVSYYLVFHTVDFTGNWLFQAVYVHLGEGPAFLNCGYAAVLVVASVTYLVFRNYQLEHHAAVRAMLVLCVIHYGLVAVGLLVGGFAGKLLVFVGYLNYGIVRGLYFPVTRAWITELAPDDVRATLLSAISLVGGFALAAANPILGQLMARSPAATIGGLCAALVVGGLFVFLRSANAAPHRLVGGSRG